MAKVVTWVTLKTTLISLSAVAAVAALGACKGQDEPPAHTTATSQTKKKVIDLTDNDQVEKVALESLAAYRDKNLERLADLGPPHAREKLIFIEPRNPHYQELLGDDSWRMKSLRAWDGELDKIVRGIQDNAICYYHEDDAHRYAVEVRKDDGRWYFFDLVREPKAKAKPSPGAP